MAACISAETGVGPSIASESQTCSPICADFEITEINKKKDTNSISLIFEVKNTTSSKCINGKIPFNKSKFIV